MFCFAITLASDTEDHIVDGATIITIHDDTAERRPVPNRHHRGRILEKTYQISLASKPTADATITTTCNLSNYDNIAIEPVTARSHSWSA